jgi:hypothetical protein
MTTYTTLVPQIAAQAEIMKQAISNGTISRANANDMQLMFMGIANNSGNINLVDDDSGNMFLEGSGEVNGEEWSGRINIKDIQNYLDSGEGVQIAKTIPTDAELGLKEVMTSLESGGNLDAIVSAGGNIDNFITYDNIESVDSNGVKTLQKVKKYTAKGYANLRNYLVDKHPGLFENIMRSDLAEATWADIANHSLTADQLNNEITDTENLPTWTDDFNLLGKKNWGTWDLNDKDKVKFMKTALVDRMLSQHLDQVTLGEMQLHPDYALELARIKNKGKLSGPDSQSASYLGFVNEAFKSDDLGALNNMKPGLQFHKDNSTGNWTAVETKLDDSGKEVLKRIDLGKINFKNKNSYLDVLNVLGITKSLYVLDKAGFKAFDGTSLNPNELAGARSEVMEYSNILGGNQGEEGLGFKIDEAKDEGKSVDEILEIKGVTLDEFGNKRELGSLENLETLFKNNGVIIKPGRGWNKGKKYIEIEEGLDIFNTKLNGLELTMENLDKLLHFIDQGAIAQGRSDSDEDKMIHDNILINRGR